MYIFYDDLFVVRTSQRLLQQRGDKEALKNSFSCGDPLIEVVERVARILLIVSKQLLC